MKVKPSREDGTGEGGSSGSESGQGGQEGSSGGDSNSGSSTESLGNDKGSENIKVLQLQPSNILVIDKNDIDWPTIKSEIEMMYSIWNSVLLDLYKLNVQNEDILNFSQMLDNTILSAKAEDKQKTLENLAKLYSYLPKYIDKLSADENKKNILQTKSNILNAYALVEQENWTSVEEQINRADEVYKKVTNNVEYIEDRQEGVTRVYILIKELKNSINTRDKDIFYIKYKNLMNLI